MEAKLLDILIAVRSDKMELQEAHNEIMNLLDISKRVNDPAFIANVCLSYRHDFGILPESAKQVMIFDCKEWLHAIVNNLPYSK